MAISQQAVRAAIRTTAHQDAHHVHVSTTDSVHVRHLLTERRRTKADSAPKDSEQDCRQAHHSAHHIVHDITTTREATTHRASNVAVISSEAATSRVVAEAISSVAATSRAVAEAISSAEVMASNKMDITSRRVDSIPRTSAVDSSSVAATSKAVVADMASSAEDISSEAATSRAVAEDMASSVADSASTLLAMTPMQNIA